MNKKCLLFSTGVTSTNLDSFQKLNTATSINFLFLKLRCKFLFVHTDKQICNRFIYINIGQCPNDRTGEEIAQGLFLWKIEDAKNSQTFTCPLHLQPNRPRQNASRNCSCQDSTCKNPIWEEPYTRECDYTIVEDPPTTETLSKLYQVLNYYIVAIRLI